MGENVKKLVEDIISKRQVLDNLLADIPLERLEEPLVPGGWSLKDITAHITWYEREVIPALLTRVLEGSELWELPLEERNQVIYQQNKDRLLADVLAEAKDVFPRFVQAVAALDDADLEDPARFQYMPAIWKPVDLITSNSTEHYIEHTTQVHTWLAK
ncbi:MAG TPA: DinB family protein [Anaerolineaceae bacterium]|nr:DinB family protein [Anaerolineaceae bacterium]HQP07495.1 DinB family protein [Anaerolineaceae bacterium]